MGVSPANEVTATAADTVTATAVSGASLHTLLRLVVQWCDPQAHWDHG
jgi:hypothetical protein